MVTPATSRHCDVSASWLALLALAVAITLGGCAPALESCPPGSAAHLGCFRDVLTTLESATETSFQYEPLEGYWYARPESVLFEAFGNADYGTLRIEASFPSVAGHPIPDRVDGFLQVMDEIAPGSRQWATEMIHSDHPDGSRSFGALTEGEMAAGFSLEAYVREQLPPLYDAPPTAEPRIRVGLTYSGPNFNLTLAKANFTDECADPVVVDELFCEQVQIHELTGDGTTLLVPTVLNPGDTLRAAAICDMLAIAHFDRATGNDLGYEYVVVLDTNGDEATDCEIVEYRQ